MNKAIFIDKDGTLIPDIPYNVDPDKITLHKGAAEGLKLLSEKGYQVIVVTNQSGVARGFFEEKDLIAVEHKIKSLLQVQGIALTAFYYCPHHPEGIIKAYAISCSCRKPEPGMIRKAAEDLHIDLTKSWMIGDILNDVEAGNRAGCKTVLINNGGETEWVKGEWRTPFIIAAKIEEAAHRIDQLDNANEAVSHERMEGL